jgi:DNA primase large subunit
VFTTDITEIIKVLGGEALFLAAAAWLIKALVSNRLRQEAEAFKIRLQADASVELEKLRASLQLAATEHQIRFAKLHEQRALIIADLHTRLVHARTDAARFIIGDVRNAELAAEMNAKMLDLYGFITLNKIYLPEKICELVEQFESTLRKSVISVDIFWTRVNEYSRLSPENQHMQNQVMLEACNFLESKSPAMLEELVREFRILLGEHPRPKSSTSQIE